MCQDAFIRFLYLLGKFFALLEKTAKHLSLKVSSSILFGERKDLFHVKYEIGNFFALLEKATKYL